MSVAKPQGKNARFSVGIKRAGPDKYKFLDANADTRNPHVQTSWRGDGATNTVGNKPARINVSPQAGTLSYDKGMDADD